MNLNNPVTPEERLAWIRGWEPEEGCHYIEIHPNNRDLIADSMGSLIAERDALAARVREVEDERNTLDESLAAEVQETDRLAARVKALEAERDAFAAALEIVRRTPAESALAALRSKVRAVVEARCAIMHVGSHVRSAQADGCEGCSLEVALDALSDDSAPEAPAAKLTLVRTAYGGPWPESDPHSGCVKREAAERVVAAFAAWSYGEHACCCDGECCGQEAKEGETDRLNALRDAIAALLPESGPEEKKP